MLKPIKRRSKKAGLPPGTLVHIGDKKVEQVKISVREFDNDEFHETILDSFEDCLTLRDRATVTWISIDGIHSIDTLAKLGECYGFHPLVLEDILNTDQRPKMEDYDTYIYVVLKVLSKEQSDIDDTLIEQVSMIIGSNYVISFQEKETDLFAALVDRIRSGKGRIRKMGADYLAYALLDVIVDRYFVILESLGERLEYLEEDLVTHPDAKTLQEIHRLKREMIFLRRSVWPLREVISALQRAEASLISTHTHVYLRDVYDHTIQVIETIETYRDILSGMLDIYLSSISNRLNAVMKVLTIIATIFMPLTFIAGVYGMNFKYMPELEWHYGYPAILLGMLSVALAMLVYFKRKKWM
ncbi:MAG TPA: magnesium and cobalt transport protein CorA [Syntrophobacteraceae bacterium]|nr:magnesium and cobalt transport protein CorA [Syntrophobacteraceae bacterium]